MGGELVNIHLFIYLLFLEKVKYVRKRRIFLFDEKREACNETKKEAFNSIRRE